jgi:hypothetical protein
MLEEQDNHIKPKHFSFIISKSKFYPYIISVLTITISYYFSLYYVGGDQLHYTRFYYDIRGVNIFTAYIMYRNYLSASEPTYFIIIYLVSSFVDKNIFMALVNGVFMFYVTKLMIFQRINKLFILTLLFNFYFLVLFLAAERLKFSLLFFVLFIYYFQKKKTSFLFLILSILSHVQTILLLLSVYINKLVNTASNIFIHLKFKKSSYIVPIFIISFFVLYILKDHIVRKIGSYSGDGFNIYNIVKPVIFMVFTFFIYKKKFPKIFLMFLPIIVGSYFFGESRIVIFAYFLFFFLSFRESSKINIYIFLTSIYFIYKGVVFLNDVMMYGTGFK